MKIAKITHIFLMAFIACVFFGFASANSLNAAVLYSDDFNDGVADGWTPVNGVWAVEGGEYSATHTAESISVVDSSTTLTGLTIESDVFIPADSTWKNGFIIFDYTAPNNYKFVAVIDGGNQWRIGTRTPSSGFQYLVAYSENIDTSRWYRMRVEINGATAALYVDDDRDGSGFVYKTEYTFSSMGSGKVGLAIANSHTHWDNYTLEDIDVPPSLTITQPDGVNDSVLAGDIYNITYTLNSNQVVTAAFYYDTDNTGLDGTAITGACAAAAEGTGVTCSWDTTGMAKGSYYIYGITDDGIFPQVSAYSAGQVTIIEPVPAPVYQRIKAIKDKLDAPSSIATDANDRIYVAETSFNRLSIYSPGGHFLKRLKGLDNPFSIEVDSTGRIFVGNGKTGNVEIYDFNFNLLSKLGSGDGEFKTPCAIAIDSTDNIYVADCAEDKIKVYNPDGSFNFSFGGPGNGNGQFNYPTSITIDENSGEIIIPDTRFVGGMMGDYQAPRVQVFDKLGSHRRTFGLRGVGEGLLFRPESVAVDAESRIYISDGYQNVVQVYDSSGTYLASLYDSANPLTNPLGITIGNSNRLFIAAHGSESIEIYGIDNFRNMVVAPLSFIFEGSEGGVNPALQNLGISNSGTEPFSWNVSSNDAWITLSEASGSLSPGGISTVNIGVDLTGLTAGIYTGTVDVNADSGAPEMVNVTLTVTLPPELSVSPPSLVFDSVNGSVPPSQALAIENIGEGTLDWTASPDMAWISLNKNSGTAPDTLNVSVDPTSLGEGTYSGNINVNGAGALGSPATIPVTLNVISLTGTINVTANHAGATFVINGPASYSGSGTGWSTAGAPIGTYVIAFGNIAGYITPPSQGLTLQTDGTINFSGQYQPETGTITVTTNLAESTFTLSGPASYSGSGTSWSVSDAPVGTYNITFGDAAGYSTPSSESQTLKKHGTIAFNGQYEINYRNIISGAGHGESNPGLVEVSSNLGQPTGVSFNAHSYMYGVNVAAGDIDGDGLDEIITAPGPGPDNPAEIRIFNRNGTLLTNLNITAFAENGGANVASADFDGDGNYEVIAGTGADRRNPASVRIFVYDSAQLNLADSGIDLLAYSSLYGVNVSAGDVDGDGTPELITSPGPGNKNLGVIKIWSIDTSSGVGQWSTSLMSEFTVSSEYKYSVTIAAGDVNGDGKDEIITGDGPHSKARDVVRVFDKDGLLLHVWQAGTSFEGYGANVASGDLENDGVSEILAAPGPGADNTSYIKIFDDAGAEKTAFYPFNLQYGANITAGNLGLEVQQ